MASLGFCPTTAGPYSLRYWRSVRCPLSDFSLFLLALRWRDAPVARGSRTHPKRTRYAHHRLAVYLGQDSSNGIAQATGLLSSEGLVMVGRDGRAQPRLAQSWVESEDGLSWTFQLRPDAFFHDGSPVDSDAVKASLARTLASQSGAFSAGVLDIVAFDTPKPDQLVIRLKTRSAFVLDDLTVSIIKVGPKGQPLGTGPYVTSSTSPEKSS